ncbi:glutaminyl-peptide cyclotransferase-like isoform X1 [Rhagoletis pomonella]|uniref:glutaminyl-peptide cyclotransferase-like isoform X1 n=1 Tax=Rhagoletis pomonella TaxID=28610 RepID=UPI0017862F97|nr:glutaminyl-peptide cyclotransferase-like isoform X1 [Rhagoletis pomonella]
MKFFPWRGKNLRFYNRWLRQLGNTIGVRERPKIYNLGACFELDELMEYRAGELSETDFLNLGQLSDVPHLRKTVKNILIPRVVGTPGHALVHENITKEMQALNWTVEIDKFHETVPLLGKIHFKNIIARLNRDAERYLVLACHYDSKYFEEFEFLGATDSAVPCAMLLNLAHVLKKELEPFRKTKLSLMFIFFDGEEAIKEWGPTDSIYGARHLAKRWEEDGTINSLDMLVLLDLIGSADPTFYNFFANTEAWYSRLVDLEERLSNVNMLDRYISSGVSRQYPNRYFQPNTLRSSFVEDDHIPFLRRNVPILHLITIPFPSVWHTKDDNESIIDYTATENISRILRLFTMEYLLGAIEDNRDKHT